MLLLLLVTTSVVVFVQPTRAADSDESKWMAFKAEYGRDGDHVHAADEAKRKQLFLERLEEIEQHNAEADAGNRTYWMGVNQFTDRTDAEIKAATGCSLPERSQTGTGQEFKAADSVVVPNSVDWRREGYVTPVKNQRSCGSCYAFATTGAIEGQHFKRNKKLVSLSEQQIVDCSAKYGNNGCNGGLMTYSFQYVKANEGIDTEKSYPYQAKKGECRFSAKNVGAKISGYSNVAPKEEDLKAAVATIGPMAVAIAVPPSFHKYKRGVFDDPKCGTSLGHAVLVVGYDSSGGKDYWIVKNSWGARWGMGGYIYMSRNKNNQCGIASKASYPHALKYPDGNTNNQSVVRRDGSFNAGDGASIRVWFIFAASVMTKMAIY